VQMVSHRDVGRRWPQVAQARQNAESRFTLIGFRPS